MCFGGCYKGDVYALVGRKAAAKKPKVVVDLRDPKAREEFLMAELNNANQKLMEGNQGSSTGKSSTGNPVYISLNLCSNANLDFRCLSFQLIQVSNPFQS